MDNSKLFIAMYHYTRDLANSRYPKISALDYELFKQQIEFFSQNFNVISMQTLCECLYAKKSLPKNALLLSFDDGYVDNFSFAMPLLESYGFKGSFFVPTNIFTQKKLLDVNKIHYILASASSKEIEKDLRLMIEYYKNEIEAACLELDLDKKSRYDELSVFFIKSMLQYSLPQKIRKQILNELFKKYVGVDENILASELYLSYEQVASLKRHGHFIGLHGHEHFWLSEISDEMMKNDLDTALEILSPFIDKNAWVMCYPYGNSDENIINYAKSKGAILGLSSKLGLADLNKDDIMLLPRFDCNDFPPKSDNYLKFVEK